MYEGFAGAKDGRGRPSPQGRFRDNYKRGGGGTGVLARVLVVTIEPRAGALGRA
jgi:hypothetical protein